MATGGNWEQSVHGHWVYVDGATVNAEANRLDFVDAIPMQKQLTKPVPKPGSAAWLRAKMEEEGSNLGGHIANADAVDVGAEPDGGEDAVVADSDSSKSVSGRMSLNELLAAQPMPPPPPALKRKRAPCQPLAPPSPRQIAKAFAILHVEESSSSGGSSAGSQSRTATPAK